MATLNFRRPAAKAGDFQARRRARKLGSGSAWLLQEGDGVNPASAAPGATPSQAAYFLGLADLDFFSVVVVVDSPLDLLFDLPAESAVEPSPQVDFFSFSAAFL